MRIATDVICFVVWSYFLSQLFWTPADANKDKHDEALIG